MKMTKLSIAAAVAVSCLTTANAKPLEEAIKNVDISGTVAYRYNDYEKSSTSNNYKVATSLKSKVTDDVTFNSRFMAGNDNSTGPVSLNTNSDADGNLDVELSEANFSYTGVENATLTVGKQGIATPFTVARDAMGGESTGTGALATYSIKPVTFAAAYFNNSNITGVAGKDIATVGVLGSFAGINADAWYIDVTDVASAYTAGLSASYEVSGLKLSPSIRYSEQDNDANNNDVSTFKVDMGLTVGIFDAYLGYGESGKDGAVALDGNSSTTTFDEHWRVGLIDQADSEILFANAGAQVSEKVHVSLKHSNLDAEAAGNDVQETYGQVVYSIASNLVTYVRFGEYKAENTDATTSGRLHVQYSF